MSNYGAVFRWVGCIYLNGTSSENWDVLVSPAHTPGESSSPGRRLEEGMLGELQFGTAVDGVRSKLG